MSTSPPPVFLTTGRQNARADYWTGLLLASLGAVLLSAKAIVAKLLYHYEVDAVTVIGLRMAFAVPVFSVVALQQARKGPPLPTADLWRIVGLGLTGYYVSSFLDFCGLEHITAALERLILYLTPSFVLLISAIVLKKRITKREWFAMLIAYAGIVLAFLHDLNLDHSQVLLGGIFVLGSAIIFSIYLLGSGQLVQRIGSIRLVACAMCAASVACIAQLLLLRPLASLVLPWQVYALSLFNGIVCTVLPVFMTMMAVARIGAPNASQAGMVGPVSTLLLGMWLLGEPVTRWQVAGSALVLVGLYVLSQKTIIEPSPSKSPNTGRSQESSATLS